MIVRRATHRVRSVLAAVASLALGFVGAAGCSDGAAAVVTTTHREAGSSPEAGVVDAGSRPVTDAGSPPVTDAGRPPLADASGPIAATMNDVSILFPLPSSASELDSLLAPTAAGSQGVLLPSSLYASMGTISGTTAGVDGGGISGMSARYSDLRVVAMRIDPCFASLDPDPHGAGCTAQLRLVFQQVTWGADASTTFDSALHAFYDLTRPQFLALAQALVALRIANQSGDAGGPLAPHPIIVRQGLDGAMSMGVQRLILQYAGEKNLVRLAQLSTLINELAALWTMSAFDVASGALAATPRPIATLATGDGGSIYEEGVSVSFGSGPGVFHHDAGGVDAGPPTFAAGFGPTTATQDDYALLDDGHADGLSVSERQTAFDALVRVENPRDNSPNTVDCGSCHFATPTEKLVALPLFALDDTASSLAFQPDGVSVTAADMGATYDAQMDGPVNLHAFSYFGTLPGISQRVVNETAAVVEYLNDLSP